MSIYKADMYAKTIEKINYKKLKKIGIKVLIFDLDNTLAFIDNNYPSEKVKKLIKTLKKDFDIYILSNNINKKRVASFAGVIEVDYIYGAIKPSSFGLKKIRRKKNYAKSEMAIIGDQIMTDVLAGNRYGIHTVLVEALAVKDLKITALNRLFERQKIKKLEKKGLFKKGKYYD